MKIVINKCYGGFGVSPMIASIMFESGWTDLGTPVEKWYNFNDKERLKEYQNDLREWLSYLENYETEKETPSSYARPFSKDGKFVIDTYPEDRTNPYLIQAVEEFGEESFGPHSELKVVEIPDDVQWVLEEYDGIEWIAEKHRVWD